MHSAFVCLFRLRMAGEHSGSVLIWALVCLIGVYSAVLRTRHTLASASAKQLSVTEPRPVLDAENVAVPQLAIERQVGGFTFHGLKFGKGKRIVFWRALGTQTASARGQRKLVFWVENPIINRKAWRAIQTVPIRNALLFPYEALRYIYPLFIVQPGEVWFLPHGDNLNTQTTSHLQGRRFANVGELDRKSHGLANSESHILELPIGLYQRPLIYSHLPGDGSNLILRCGGLLLSDTQLLIGHERGGCGITAGLSSLSVQNIGLIGHFLELLVYEDNCHAGCDKSQKANKDADYGVYYGLLLERTKLVVLNYFHSKWLSFFGYFGAAILLLKGCCDLLLGGGWDRWLAGSLHWFLRRTITDRERLFIAAGLYIAAIRLGVQAVVNVSQ